MMDLITCQCGCGLFRDRITGYRRRYYIVNHDKKGKEYIKGSNNPNWNGGIFIDKFGYVHILRPDHPNSDNRGYIKEHRLIYENYLSILFDQDIFIPKNYDIHHINENTSDNSLINLQLVTRSEHTTIHNLKDHSETICLLCKSDKTNKKENGRPHWFIFENGYICQSCYGKQYHNKKKIEGLI